MGINLWDKIRLVVEKLLKITILFFFKAQGAPNIGLNTGNRYRISTKKNYKYSEYSILSELDFVRLYTTNKMSVVSNNN